MEMTAVIEGLLALKRPCQVTLVSWTANTCAKASPSGSTAGKPGAGAPQPSSRSKTPICGKNSTVVSSSGHQIDWRWVKGHNGDPGNERADALANQGVDKALGR
jgi:ribonuclease HI